MMKRGFSLVELSIVLVILGLLVGGILAGQSLIRASELRAVGNESQRYMTAVYAFRDKYFALPGDMANATAVWGKSATYCNGHTGTASSPINTCNGDGDGTINGPGGVGTAETYQFWRQLSLAGLIEGQFSGISPAGGWDTVLGGNSPASKLSGAGWNAFYRISGAMFFGISRDNNMLQFGTPVTGGSIYGKAISPEEAWNIDTKLDDGRPASGKIHVIWWDECTDAANAITYTGNYLLSDPSIQCGLAFVKSF